MVDPKFPMKVPGGPPSDACLSGSSWRCSKTGLNLSMSLNEWYIIIWYTALQITHMILQCDIQIATLRKKPGLVAVGLRSPPLPGEYSANDQPSSAVKGKTYNWVFFPSIQDHKKKHPKQPPAPWPYLRYRAWAATQRSDHLSDLDFVAPRFRRFQATVSDCCEVFWTLRVSVSDFFSPKNLEDTLKLDKFNL